MKKLEVAIALEAVAEARSKWVTAMAKFNSDVDYVMARLLHEAAANYMSVEEMAKASGMTNKYVRRLMRNQGLDPKQGKRLLARHAATALAENATLMGIEPYEMDLTSPLAYLPMGSQLRDSLQSEAVKGVTELPWDRAERLGDVFKIAWHAADKRGETGDRTHHGIAAVLAVLDAEA